MKGDKCRSGCRTRDHETYGECLRVANIRANFEVTPTNRWDRDLEHYRKAREQGIQPQTTNREDVDVATAFSDDTGVAFDAGDMTGTLLKARGVDLDA